MKFQSLLLAATIVASSFAQAATSNTVSTQAPKNIWANETSSEGFRVAVTKPMVDFKLKAGGASSAGYKMNEAVGVSLGYANLPVEQLGWTADVAYINGLKLKDTDSSDSVTWNAARISGNLGYAFTEMFNVKGGVNLTKMVSGPSSSSFSPSVGFQLGAGVQFTNNFGLDLNYLQMNQTFSVSGLSIDAVMTGYEIALHGTF